jgi:hypothetical protein
VIFEDPAITMRQFQAVYGPQIDDAVEAICQAFGGLTAFREAASPSLRSEAVEIFLHSAIYSLIAALHHLVTGYAIACGHMMRHVYESVGMAALCADEKAQVLERFNQDRGKFRVDNIPDKLLQRKVQDRLKALLGIDASAWREHLKKNWDFGGRSHATWLTIAFQMKLDSESMLVIGGEYDSGKDHAYQADLKRIVAMGRSVGELGKAIAAIQTGRDEAVR